MIIREHALQQAVKALEQGGCIIFPTDTVYGLGVGVRFVSGVDEIYRLKKRDSGKPIAWLVGSKQDLNKYGREVPDFAQQLAQKYWPGPLTLVLKASEAVPAAFRSDQGTIALRMPNDETALSLINTAGTPIATTSANLSGNKDARSFQEIDTTLKQAVAYALNDERDHSGVASTVIDCTGVVPKVLREGSLKDLDKGYK